MTEQEKNLGSKYTKQHGKICSPLPPGLLVDGENPYKKAAKKLGITVEIRNVGPDTKGNPLCMITFPNGEDKQVQETVYQLAGGMAEFYKKFKPVEEKKAIPEPLPPCSTKAQANNHPVWEWVKGLIEIPPGGWPR